MKDEDAEKEREVHEKIALWEAQMKEESEKSQELIRQIDLQLQEFAAQRQDLMYFCFGADFVLTVESIVRGCLANLNRANLTGVKVKPDEDEVIISPHFTTAESILEKIQGWAGVAKFDEEKIKIYSTKNLKPEVNFQKWLDGLQELRWYGPF